MAPVPDTRLADLADAALAAVEARYNASGLLLPERRYIHVGEVAYDCEQLVVALASIDPGLPQGAVADGVSGTPVAFTARIEVHLVRCAPTPSGGRVAAPKVSALNDAGRAALLDSREVLKALTAARATLTESCGQVVFTGSSFNGPEGGYLGVVTTFGALL